MALTEHTDNIYKRITALTTTCRSRFHLSMRAAGNNFVSRMECDDLCELLHQEYPADDLDGRLWRGCKNE